MSKTDEVIYPSGSHIIAEWGEVYEVLEDKGRAFIQVKLAYTPSTHGEVLRRQLKPYRCVHCGDTSLLAVVDKEYRCTDAIACAERKEQNLQAR